MIDKKFRAPRLWSNGILRLVCPHCYGDVVNVSGWKDEDKEGGWYKDYFTNGEKYIVSNHANDFRGYQGVDDNELMLDLEKELPQNLKESFDVVFNHTTLEHVFDVQTAFKNLCLLSRKQVLVVVPFLQEQHHVKADFGDFWRFTPTAIRELFSRNGFRLEYVNFNDVGGESIYVVAVGIRKEMESGELRHLESNQLESIDNIDVGTKLVKNSLLYRFIRRIGIK